MNFLQTFSENAHISNFVITIPVGDELFHADGQASRQTDMTKLIVAFRNLANAPKSQWLSTNQGSSHCLCYESC
jgi:hypothetical protein